MKTLTYTGYMRGGIFICLLASADDPSPQGSPVKQPHAEADLIRDIGGKTTHIPDLDEWRVLAWVKSSEMPLQTRRAMTHTHISSYMNANRQRDECAHTLHSWALDTRNMKSWIRAANFYFSSEWDLFWGGVISWPIPAVIGRENKCNITTNQYTHTQACNAWQLSCNHRFNLQKSVEIIKAWVNQYARTGYYFSSKARLCSQLFWNVWWHALFSLIIFRSVNKTVTFNSSLDLSLDTYLRKLFWFFFSSSNIFCFR